MQDNNWTDDAEFWDDAWADMSDRLDARDKPKYPFWLFLIPLFLLLGYGIYYFSTHDSSNIIASPQVQKIESEKASPNPPAGNERKSEVTTPPPSPPTDDRAMVTTPSVGRGTLYPANRNATETEPSSAGEANLTSDPATDRLTEAPKPAGLGSTATVATLPLLPIEGVEFSPSFTLPAVHPVGPAAPPPSLKKQLRSRWALEGGVSTSTQLDNVGLFSGVSFTALRRGKWDVPVHLRYRLDRRAIQTIILPVDSSGSVGVFDQSDFGPLGGSDPLNFDGTDSETVNHHSLELNTGLGYTLHPKWRLFALGSLQYQLRFTGPRVVDNVGREVLDFTQSSSFDQGVVTGNGFSSEPGRGGGDLSLPEIRVDRWWFGGEVGLDYYVTRGLSTRLSVHRLVGPQTTRDAVRFERTRLQLGLSYRFR